MWFKTEMAVQILGSLACNYLLNPKVAILNCYVDNLQMNIYYLVK